MGREPPLSLTATERFDVRLALAARARASYASKVTTLGSSATDERFRNVAIWTFVLLPASAIATAIVVAAAPGAAPLVRPLLLAGAVGQTLLSCKTFQGSRRRLREASLAGATTGRLWLLASAAAVVGLLAPALWAAMAVLASLADVGPLHC